MSRQNEIGDARIKDSPKIPVSGAVTRDRVIAAIYETVIRPELYDAFMDAWNDHIQLALGSLDGAGMTPEGADDLALDPELQAHFSRAREILDQIGRKIPKVSLPDQVRDAGGLAILAKADGQVLAHSVAATNLLGGQGRLDAVQAVLTANSGILLDQLCQAARDGLNDPLPVVLSTGSVPRHLMARTVGPDDAGQVLVLLEALEYQWSPQAEAMLVTSFGLSRAEVDIVRNLLAGYSLREMAERSGRSEHTVRNQAKAVLAKTGAPGQVDLIRLVVYLINQEARTDTARNTGGPLPDTIMRMSSGLGMQVFRVGPEDGQPVLFLHGMLDGVGSLKFLETEIIKRGLRVIAPVRPGFGRSSPAKRIDQAMDVFVDHIGELIGKEGLKRPVIIGHMGGALYGHVIAARLPELIAGLVAVGCGAPIRNTSQFTEMAPRQRIVAYTARYAPALLPTVLRAGIAQIDGKDISGFMTALYKPDTHDYDLINRLDLAGHIQSGYRFSVQQGPIGFATDSHYIVRDWGKYLTGSTTPAVYLNGGLDPVSPPEFVVQLMGQRPEVSVRVMPELGQLIFYERPELVFDAVAEMAIAGN